MKYLVLIFISLCSISTHSFAGHGGVKNNSPSRFCADINKAPNLNCASAPSSVFSTTGRLWVVWSYTGHIYVSYSDDKSKSFSAPITVNNIPEDISARGENRPKIAINKQGDIFVSWTTPLAKPYSGNIRFSYLKYLDKFFSKPITVNDNLEVTGHRFDSMTVTDNGGIYIAWLDKRDKLIAKVNNQPYTGAAVYYAYSSDAGKSFKPNKKIIDNSCECCRIAIDFDKHNLPVVLWRNVYGKNTRDHALAYFESENKAATPIRVSFDNWNIDACPHHRPDLNISESNKYHMVWFNNAKKRHGLFYARMDKDNNELSKPINFGNYNATASHPTVISHKNHVYLSWKEFDGNQETLWLKHSLNNGDSWNESTCVSATKKGADYPFLLKLNNEIFIQWQTKLDGYNLIPINSKDNRCVSI